MLNKILRILKNIIPKKLFFMGQPVYHFILSFLGALFYRFPSKKLNVVGITGTKGKTSTIEILNAIFEEAGYKTALSSTLRFKTGKESEKNKYKMTMPGRFFVQKFLNKAKKNNCQYVFLEMTSQGVLQHRHKFIQLDSLIFTNLSPEHIESHGSYKKYVDAKLKIAKALEKSKKKNKVIVSNVDDKEGYRFLSINIEKKYPYSVSNSEPYVIKKEGLEMTIDNIPIKSQLSGKFNLMNIISATTYAKSQGINIYVIKKALEKFNGIRGRLEKIEEGQDFTVVVDYAHTADSLEKVYEVFQTSKKICVLGNTGGGRDKWKRKEMAKIADKHCSYIIFTNEDPYDDDPMEIVLEMKKEIEQTKTEVIINRRDAISKALSVAETGDTVLITGKGTDPYIMGQKGTKEPWDDATVVREELNKISNIS